MSDAEVILHKLYERLGEIGLMFLVTLEEGPMLKDQLKERVNEMYTNIKETKEVYIKSRHTLDILTAGLEKAALVDVKEIGRARMFSISELGRIMIDYAYKQKETQK